MKRRLLDLMVCSACKSALAVSVAAEEADGHIMEGLLACSGCTASFPILRGIPRMAQNLSAEKQATAEAFGYEWTHFTTLDEQYKAEFLDWIWPVQQEFFRGKTILDAGCGKGRHSYLSSQFGAMEVVGIDLSDAVESAFQNTRALGNVHVVQADIYNLPFLRPFDYSYSIGVLHHLPDPRQGFLSVVSHLKAGGRMSAWVYGREGNGWIVALINPLRKLVTARAPKLMTRAISFVIAVPLYVALKCVYGPVSHRPSLKWMSKFLFYYDYLAEISRYSFAENYWNVFDHLVAPTAFYHTKAEITEWFAAGKLTAVEISQRTGNSWRGTGLASETPTHPELPNEAATANVRH